LKTGPTLGSMASHPRAVLRQYGTHPKFFGPMQEAAVSSLDMAGSLTCTIQAGRTSRKFAGIGAIDDSYEEPVTEILLLRIEQSNLLV
jgi:hypothetical protein